MPQPPSMTRPPLSLVALCAAATVVVALAGAATATVESRERAKGAAPSSPACREGRLSTSYLRRVNRVLRARHDAWGRTLLSSPRGPTYERIERYLPPLFFARGRNGRPLTDSGVHYTHFSQPERPRGATSFALHVADGSQVITRRSHGRRLTVGVGLRGQERYGSCLRRLELPRLVDGYLPILVTRYTDSHGVRYEQESFVARIPETRSLVSFVRVVADAGDARTKLVRLRFTPSVDGLESDGSRLRRAGRTYVVYGEGGSYSSPSVKFAVRRGEVRTAYVGWLHQPSRTRPLVLDELRYLEARASVQEFWDRKLAHGGLVVVPEERVNDAARNLLIQNLGMTWRYSVGNRYEQLSTPEAVDVARVLGGYGHLAVSRTILRTAVQKQPARPLRRAARRTNWRIGARLVGFGHYARLAGDRSEIVRATPALRRYVKTIGGQLRASRNGLLPRERFSSDVGERVYGLHTQVVVWQGLRAMSQVWEDEGFTRLAAESRRLARKLESGLRRAIRRSQRRLPSGALFIPAQLLEDVAPYRAVTNTRSGSYWNLVMPYTLASGLFPPHGQQAKGLLRYLDRHGARLLGLVRAGAYGLYGPGEPRKSGSNPVYRLNVARSSPTTTARRISCSACTDSSRPR